ncbi:MAG: tRNA pseudouridine synthase A [Gemmatimonadota bacterium]|nr:tRNA pseudouridine synthase A [Gemmatimonadota bacterium]
MPRTLEPLLARLYVWDVTSEETRLALTLHYDGGAFFGWQAQREERTVQGELEAAVRRLTGSPRTVMGSGRTDRGVHATGQVAAVTVPAQWSAVAFRNALNAVLPTDVWVREARAAGLKFHPRYDALARTYAYYVGLSEAARSPFVRRWCWSPRRHVERRLLDWAAAQITGEHSFGAFAKTGQPERGPRCVVRSAGWTTWKAPAGGQSRASALGLEFTITADRYLHHMVRYLVGTMVEIAGGARPAADLAGLLAEGASAQRPTSPPAPARGLFLTRVEYPETTFDPSAENGRDGAR